MARVRKEPARTSASVGVEAVGPAPGDEGRSMAQVQDELKATLARHYRAIADLQAAVEEMRGADAELWRLRRQAVERRAAKRARGPDAELRGPPRGRRAPGGSASDDAPDSGGDSGEVPDLGGDG